MDSSKQFFGYADVGRFGLGHGLLAWARCVVWCHKTGARMLAPRWFRLRVGPYLRREQDRREYFKLFNNAGYIRGPQKMVCWLTANHLSAESALPPADFTPHRPTIVIFKNALAANEKKHFHEVMDYGPLLHQELLRITRRQYQPKPITAPFIAIHVRMGDFTKPTSPNDIYTMHNIRLPLEWYVETLDAARSALGHNFPAIVFSDGDDAELLPLLAVAGVQRAPRQESITDMLSIAQAVLLISSNSGFSRWGAFLGDVPRISFPGQSGIKIHKEPTMELERPFGSVLPDFLITCIKSRWLTPGVL